MRVQSAKQKGRRLQQYVRDKIYEYFPSLRSGDVRSTPMGVSGSDIMLSPAARDVFNFDVECKNVEKLNVWKAIEQAESNRDNEFNSEPIVIISRNKAKKYVVVELDYFMKIHKESIDAKS